MSLDYENKADPLWPIRLGRKVTVMRADDGSVTVRSAADRRLIWPWLRRLLYALMLAGLALVLAANYLVRDHTLNLVGGGLLFWGIVFRVAAGTLFNAAGGKGVTIDANRAGLTLRTRRVGGAEEVIAWRRDQMRCVGLEEEGGNLVLRLKDDRWVDLIDGAGSYEERQRLCRMLNDALGLTPEPPAAPGGSVQIDVG